MFCDKIHYRPEDDFIITKLTFYGWNKKNIQDFNVQPCMDCWGNDCHPPPGPLNDMQPLIMSDLRNLLLFCTRQKFQHHRLGQCRFFIDLWRSLSSNHMNFFFPLVHFNLILFCLSVMTAFHLAFLSVNSISFGCFCMALSKTFTSVNLRWDKICYIYYI